MVTVAVGADHRLAVCPDRRIASIGSPAFVAGAAQLIDILSGEQPVRLHLVVLIGQVTLTRPVTRLAADLLLEMLIADKLILHVHVADGATGQRIVLERVFRQGEGVVRGAGGLHRGLFRSSRLVRRLARG